MIDRTPRGRFICAPALLLAAEFFLSSTVEAAVLRVPADHPTIQQAIDAAVNGDTVQVAPGTYLENLNFHGQEIALVSEQGARDTIIDGRALGSVLLFESGETPATLVSGFTLRNGQAAFGSGVYALGSSPTLVDNIFEANVGGSIMGFNSSMILQRNLFRGHTFCSSGVVWFVNGSSPSIKDNVFAGNRCKALNIVLPEGNQPDVANNTFVNNDVGLNISAQVSTSTHRYRNNLFFGNGIGLSVESGSPLNFPALSNNLFFGNTTQYTGMPNPIGTNGNIAGDPRLGGISADDYHPDPGSAAIDAGDNAAVDGGDADFHGDTRIRDGGSGVARVDIGAGEYISTPPTVTLNGGPSSIALGESLSFNWSSTNATSCRADGAWSGARALSGSETVTPTVSGTLTFKIVCGNTAAERAGLVTVIVYPPPTISINLSYSPIQEDYTSYLSWSATPATSCTASGAWSGTQPTSGSQAVSAAPGTHTYTLSCVGPGGSSTASATLTVIARPQVTFTVVPEHVAEAELATLEWSAVGATACDASGSWTGSRAFSGTQSIGPLPAGVYFYSLTCQGAGGWTQVTQTLFVHAAPTIAIAVAPTGVRMGTEAVVTWSSTDATTCSASGAWGGTLATAGTLEVTPQTSGVQNFVITCEGPGGTTQNSTQLTVFTPPTATLTLSPSSIQATDSATVSWTSTDATACTAANAWAGPLSPSGSQSITQSSAGTYVYEITCNGAGGSVTRQATLTVTAKPAEPSGGGGGGGGALGWLEVALFALLSGAGIFARRRKASIRAAVVASVTGLCSVAGAAETVVLGSPVPVGDSSTFWISMRADVADLNGDGAPDVVAGFNFAPARYFLNNGTSSPFANVSGKLTGSTSDLQQGAYARDLNGDGRPDILAGGFNGPTRLYLNNGTADPFNGVVGANVGTTTDPTVALAVGDVDGDGRPDIAAANTNHVVNRVYLNNGTAAPFSGVTALTIGSEFAYANDIKLADVNGDARLDAVVAFLRVVVGEPAGVFIYLNNGTGDPFGGVTPLQLGAGSEAFQVAIADVNGDTGADLVVFGPNGARLHFNSGSATQPYDDGFAFAQSVTTSNYCTSIVLADVSGDSLVDAILNCGWAQGGPPQQVATAIFVNNGTTSPFGDPQYVRMAGMADGPFVRSAQLANVDGISGPEFVVADDHGGVTYYRLASDQVPVANGDTAATTVGRAVSVDVLANDTDADGTLVPSSIAITTPPTHGTATINSLNGISYTPEAGFSGTDSVAYTVRDDSGVLSNAAVLQLSVRPPPVAGNDSASTTTSMAVTVNVVSNDTSSAGSIVPSTLAITKAPSHGTVSINPTAYTLTYQPAPGYTGADSFEYTVSDDVAATSNTATVSISISAPAASGGGGGGGGGGAFGGAAVFALGLMVLARRGFRSRLLRIH